MAKILFSKKVLAIILLAILCIVFIQYVYSISDMKVDWKDPFLVSREIETKKKLLINGYLGTFLRFKYVGNINWIALAIIPYLILTIRNRARWEKALLFVFICTAILIGIEGNYNYRYALTLIPFTATVVLLFSWEIIKKYPLHIQISGFFIILILALVNINRYSSDYQSYNRYVLSTDNIPWKIIMILNTLDKNEDEKILSVLAPTVYYYTDVKALTYQKQFVSRIKSAGIANPNTIDNIFYEPIDPKNKDYTKKIDLAYNTLVDKYHIKYVITRSLPSYYSEISEIIKKKSQLIINENGYSLYRLNQKTPYSFVKYKNNPVFQGIYPAVIKRNNKYLIFYSDEKGNMIYRRECITETQCGLPSQTGIVGQFPFVWIDNGTIRLIYVDTGNNYLKNINLATSTNGITFTSRGRMLTVGNPDAWDSEYIHDPTEIKNSKGYYLFYSGKSKDLKNTIGVAKSLTGAPMSYIKKGIVFGSTADWDKDGVFDPHIYEYKNHQYMIMYTGWNGTDQKWGFVTSHNLEGPWKKSKNNPIMWSTQAWESNNNIEPSCLIENMKYKCWYRGNSPKFLIGYLYFDQDFTTKLPILNLKNN